MFEFPRFHLFIMVSTLMWVVASFVCSYWMTFDSITWLNFMSVGFQVLPDIRYKLLALILIPITSLFFFWFIVGFISIILIQALIWPIIRTIALSLI